MHFTAQTTVALVIITVNLTIVHQEKILQTLFSKGG